MLVISAYALYHFEVAWWWFLMLLIGLISVCLDIWREIKPGL
jgi:hypothetical protein